MSSNPAPITKRVRWEDMHALPNNPIQLARLERIEREGGFKPQQVGTPEVALNDAGAFPDLPEDAYVLIDGHHRRELWSRANGNAGPDDVICKVHRGLTRQQIEKLFLAANDYRSHHVNELFVHRVESGDHKAIAINKIIEMAGFHVPPHPSTTKGAIRGVNAAEWVYDGGKRPARAGSKVNPQALMRTLDGLRVMYGNDDKDATRSNLIKGLGLFHLRYRDSVDLDRLHRNVPAAYPTAALLLTAGSGVQNNLKLQVPDALGYVLRIAYNGSRRGKHDLPDWR